MLRRNSRHFGRYNNRPHDWICPGCDCSIFGSKDICQKCNINRIGQKICSEIHPSGDWNCPKCKFRVSENKQYCNKCNIDKYGDKCIIQEEKNIDNNWNCPACNIRIFESKQHCRKCKVDKNGKKIKSKKKKTPVLKFVD
jgi:hypothetical protein